MTLFFDDERKEGVILEQMEINKRFVKLMMNYLEKRGLSLNQLAQLSGVSPSLLSRIKTGTRKAPGLDKAWSIITVLNIPDEEILSLFKSKVL